MAYKKDRPPITKPIDHFNFLSMDSMVDMKLPERNVVKAIPNWFVTIDASYRIHMFSAKPMYAKSIGRWIPQRASTVGIYLDTLNVCMDGVMPALDFSQQCFKVEPIKDEDPDAVRERTTLTDREIRHIVLTGAEIGEEFIIRNVTRYNVEIALAAEAKRRGCHWFIDRSKSTTYIHYCQLY